MPTIALGLLPPPHSVAMLDGTVVNRSSIGRLPFHRVPDPDVNPRVFQFGWVDLVGAAADALQRHYDEHPHEPFVLALPGTGEEVRVQLVGPPNIQWSSAAFASSVTVEAEEVLAHE